MQDSLNDFVNNILSKNKDILVSKIGKVVNVNSKHKSKRTVDVIPLPSENNSLILNVPVLSMFTSQYYLNIPLKKDDLVLILFIDHDIDKILEGEDRIVSNETHSYKDCVCIAGLNRIDKDLVLKHQLDGSNLDVTALNIVSYDKDSKEVYSSVSLNKEDINIKASNVNIDAETVTIKSKNETSTWK